jgi:HK97 family phage major capsid protein
MDKLKLLRELLAKETDPAKKQAYEDEVLKEIAEQERVKAETKANETFQGKLDEATRESAKLRSQLSGMGANLSGGAPASSGIVVGTPALYKGYKLKAEIASLMRPYKGKGGGEKHSAIAAELKADPVRAEAVAKFWLDMYEAAIKNPGREQAVFKEGMNEGTTTAGGYLTPTEQMDVWDAYARDESVALQFARVVPMTSDIKLVNKENATVASLSGVAITAEATAATVVTPTVDQTTLTAKRLDGYTHITVEDLEDAQVAGGFVAQLLDQFSEAAGQTIDSCVFVGSGSPMSGVFKSAGYSQAFSSGSAAFSMLLEADLRGIIAKITKRGTFRFYGNHAIFWNTVYGLKDSNGRPLFIPAMNAALPNSLYGYPTSEVPICPATSAASTGFLGFGDLYQAVLIGRRSDRMSFFVDPYTKGLAHQTIFALFLRYAFAQHLTLMFGRIVTSA